MTTARFPESAGLVTDRLRTDTHTRRGAFEDVLDPMNKDGERGRCSARRRFNARDVVSAYSRVESENDAAKRRVLAGPTVGTAAAAEDKARESEPNGRGDDGGSTDH
jgi:hypothetical protein